jgi:hypothetical protein
MSKRILVAVVAMALTLGFCGAGFAAKLKCEISTVEGDKVTMTCEDAGKLKAGDKIKVSPPKKGAVEGC